MILSVSNFREINNGKISSNTLYRSSQPIFNGKQVNDIINTAVNSNIKTIINLSDDINSLKNKINCCPWYKNIFDDNNVIALGINMNFNIMDMKFTSKIKNALIFMIEHEPPYLIHCEAGIDRTGFLSIILEAFMEADIKDIIKDYALSFVDKNEYTLNDFNKNSIFIKNLFTKIKGELISSNENLQNLAIKYLIEKIGLNNEQLILLKNKLMNNNGIQ